MRICKICGKPYEAEVLTSSNTFSQRLESINEEIRRHSYWLCDNCWEDSLNKPDIEMKAYIPNKLDFKKQKNVQENLEELRTKKTQKGPNISISYNLTTYSGNIFHMFPKIIVNSGFTYNFMSHGRNLEISKIISGQGISWKLDVEAHKKIRELKRNSYSWMETSYISNEIEYYQHIYFSTELIQDLIRVFDDYYRVFGNTFKKLRKMSLDQQYRSVNENIDIDDDFSTIREMRLYHDPFTDV